MVGHAVIRNSKFLIFFELRDFSDFFKEFLVKFYINYFFNKISYIFKNPWLCNPLNGIQGQLPYMNRFGQWEIGQVASSKDDLFDQDFDPWKV